MAWTQFFGLIQNARETEGGEKAFPGAIPWHDETNKKDWYKTPFQNLVEKLVEVSQGKAEVDVQSGPEGQLTLWIRCSEESDIWVCISSKGFIELGTPG